MRKHVVTALCALSLSACGGGSGDAASSPVVFNADAALTNLLTTPVSFDLSAHDAAGKNYTMHLSFTPASDFVLNGVAYKQTVRKLDGVLVDLGTQYLYTLSPTQLVAKIEEHADPGFSASGAYTHTLFTSDTALPSSGHVGTSATLATGTKYWSTRDKTSIPQFTSTSPFIVVHFPLTWSIEADTSATAFVCLTDRAEKQCFKVNTAGAILGARISLSVFGQQLTFE